MPPRRNPPLERRDSDFRVFSAVTICALTGVLDSLGFCSELQSPACSLSDLLIAQVCLLCLASREPDFFNPLAAVRINRLIQIDPKNARKKR
jgi:hypothetical protein